MFACTLCGFETSQIDELQLHAERHERDYQIQTTFNAIKMTSSKRRRRDSKQKIVFVFEGVIFLSSQKSFQIEVLKTELLPSEEFNLRTKFYEDINQMGKCGSVKVLSLILHLKTNFQGLRPLSDDFQRREALQNACFSSRDAIGFR